MKDTCICIDIQYTLKPRFHIPHFVFPQSYALVVRSWPNAHNKDVSGFYAISRWSPQKCSSQGYTVCVRICVLILNMKFSA